MEKITLTDDDYNTMRASLLALDPMIRKRAQKPILSEPEIIAHWARVIPTENPSIDIYRIVNAGRHKGQYFTIPQCDAFLERLREEELPKIKKWERKKLLPADQKPDFSDATLGDLIYYYRHLLKYTQGTLAERLNKLIPPDNRKPDFRLSSDLIGELETGKGRVALTPEREAAFYIALELNEPCKKEEKAIFKAAWDRKKKVKFHPKSNFDFSRATLGEIIFNNRQILQYRRADLVQRVNDLLPKNITTKGFYLHEISLWNLEKDGKKHVLLKPEWEEPFCAVLGLYAEGKEDEKAAFHEKFQQKLQKIPLQQRLYSGGGACNRDRKSGVLDNNTQIR